MNLIRRRSGFIRSPPGPRYKLRELISGGALHRIGTPLGVSLGFFVFACSPEKENANRSASINAISLATDSPRRLCLNISAPSFKSICSPFDWCRIQKGGMKLVRTRERQFWRGKRGMLTHESYNQLRL